MLNNGTLYLNGGASKGSGHEFDDVSLVYVDRGGFICQFSEATDTCEPPTGIEATRITSSTATISWTPVSNAQGYSLQIRKLGTTRWKTKQSVREAVKLKNLLPSTSYEYQVATVCGTETSPYSPIQVFTTTP